MGFVHTDADLYESVAASGSTAYSTGFDFVDANRSSDGECYLYVDLSTYTSGTFSISLIGDTELPLDGNSVVIQTLPNETAVGQWYLPIPQGEEYQYYGIEVAGTSPTGTVEVYGSARP